jgi:outer membrane lipoprotein-sorting protein
MNKRLCIVIAALMALLCSQVFALTADEIIAKNIVAKGGKEKMDAIKSMKMSGKIVMQGMEIPFKAMVKKPNLFRSESSFQGMMMVQAFDGKTAWFLSPMTGSTEPQEVTGAEAKMLEQQADIDGYLAHYKEKGYKVELVGEEDLDGTPVHHLRVTGLDFAKDAAAEIYLDSKTFLDSKMTVKGAVDTTKFEMDQYFTDYRDVAGCLMAHSVEVKSGGQTVSSVIMDKVEVNIPLADSLFMFPGKKPEGNKPDSATTKK